MGVLIDKNDSADTQLFKDACKEIEFIFETSQKFELSTPKTPQIKQNDKKSTKEKNNSIDEIFDELFEDINGINGYCIRTGVEIPFDIEKPMCYEAYKSWNKYGDPDYPEKYCHFSGEKSNGETSVNKPILKKNWKKAKQYINDDDL